jgi:hypothetical protein
VTIFEGGGVVQKVFQDGGSVAVAGSSARGNRVVPPGATQVSG